MVSSDDEESSVAGASPTGAAAGSDFTSSAVVAGTEVGAGVLVMPASELRGRLPDEEALRRDWLDGEGEGVPPLEEVVKLAKALEVFSKAMEAKDRRLFLETETVADPERGRWLLL